MDLIDDGRGARRPREPSGPGRCVRVLFVDDEAKVRRAFSRTLSARGFLVDVARSAAEALRLAESTSYPIVVTDLGMPDTDGVSLIRHLQLRNPSMVFVIVTGRDDIEVPTEPQLRSNVSSIISKPWDADELVDTLRRSVRLWESRSSLPPPGPGDHDANSILLLEDDDADADAIEAYVMFSNHGGRVTRRKRLSDALRVLEEDRFGVIIADLSLPDARGLDAVLRLQNVASETPLIVMSGIRDDTVAVQAVQAGAQDYLVKGEVDAAGLVRSIRYARERKRSELSLTQLAHYDPLTGLANRAHFRDRLTHTHVRAKRTGEPFAVMFVDLDEFKPVNDQHGHAAGDALLVEVSRRLERTVREYDTVARLGGDEFAVILDNLADADEVTAIAQRILGALSQPHRIRDFNARVTASIGIAFYPDGGHTAADLLKAADRAMYAAKRRGRNTYEIATPHEAVDATPVFEDAAELKRALERDEFTLHYQPQYDVGRRCVTGAEGLLRWQRDSERVVAPDEFLHLLEESGAIRGVGAWAIRRACKDFARWRRLHSSVAHVSVNVSVRQLEGSDLVAAVYRALDETGLDPSCLELELTESAIMKNLDRAKQILTELKSSGVRIAMDDFGTGPSSLSYLYQLPIDTVKIDRSFVQDLGDSSRSRSVTGGIIAMAKKIGLVVVAEGVETEEQRTLLESEGCHVLQGYLLGRPMPSDMLISSAAKRPSKRQ